MIYKKCVMTIDKNKAALDEDIYLYRLDKNIELYFTIVNNKYRFNKGDMNNIILITNASFFQVRLYKNAEIKYTFAIQPTDGGQAILTITDDLIDDPIEVGDYDFQISLLDEEKTSMISMPIVSKQLHVCEPLVSDDATMGKAILGLSKLATGEIKNAFDSEGNYIREIHKDGDILSAELINKFEEALDTNTKAIKNGTGTSYDDTEIKTDINTIKTDLGTEELTTTAKNVKGAVNEVAAQYKDIANEKAFKTLAIKKSGKNIQIAYKYNKNKDCRIRINNINANGTPQLCGNEFFSNTNSLPSIDFDSAGDAFNIGKTDFVGPIICEAKNNADTDVNTDGSLHFTGGMHDITDTIGNGSPTATNISMRTYIDGVCYNEDSNITTRANHIRIQVQNKIMASNTVKKDGNGRYVISEVVTYEIGTDMRLNVKVTLEAMEDVKIYKYYGMQGNFLGYKTNYQWALVNYLNNNDVTYYATLGTETMNLQNAKCNEILVDDRKLNTASMYLKPVGLGTFFLNAEDRCALGTQWSKVYYNLIRKDADPFLFYNHKCLFWEGVYDFKEGRLSVI